MEADYSYQLAKKIVPLKAENFKPDGWLGMLLGSKLYYDFYTPEKFEAEMEHMIRKNLAHLSSLPAVVSASSRLLPVACPWHSSSPERRSARLASCSLCRSFLRGVTTDGGFCVALPFASSLPEIQAVCACCAARSRLLLHLANRRRQRCRHAEA